MAGRWTNEGLDWLQTNDLDANKSSLVVRLYSNNYTPVATSAFANFTECTFPGYASQTGLAWIIAAAAAGVSTMTSPLMNFISTAGGGQTIYGWYVTIGSVCLMAERMGAPFTTITAAGQGVQLTITDTLTAT